MSVEQLNLIALEGLLPTIGFLFLIALACLDIWFLTVGLCWLIEFVKSKILILKGAR